MKGRWKKGRWKKGRWKKGRWKEGRWKKRLGPQASGLGLIAVAALCGSAFAQEPRKVGFREAIDLSLQQSPDVAGAKESVAGADARVAGAKAHRLPGLSVEYAGNAYTEPYKLPFGTQTFTLHDTLTTFTGVTLSQPLSGLAYLSELVGAAEHDASATRDEYDRVRLETAYRTADAYVRVLEARAGAEVAHRSVADIQSELDRALQLRQAETYTDIDVLRFRSAKAAADQQALRADTEVQAALARLVVQLGLHDGTPIELAEDLPETPPALALSTEQAIARAVATRPELRAARDRVAATGEQRQAARYRYLPDIRAIASWQHMTGTQPFQPENEEFLGVRVSWNVWDWGATRDSVREADAQVARAQIGANALLDQVRLDVREKWLDAKSAYDSIAVASTQQQTADEALRLQKVRFDNAAATTTDVLDAETDAARSRLSLALARYDYYRALVALARAMGDLPHPGS
jgi:outer membrane protein TolC